jgi:hypothetical protein
MRKEMFCSQCNLYANNRRNDGEDDVSSAYWSSTILTMPAGLIMHHLDNLHCFTWSDITLDDGSGVWSGWKVQEPVYCDNPFIPSTTTNEMPSFEVGRQ